MRLVGEEMVAKGARRHRRFRREHLQAGGAHRGAWRHSSRKAWEAVRAACDPKFSDYAIYEHCLPFNVARAYDEARGIDTPRIWTAERDKAMWDALQG